jgi:hypothetical protein
MSEHKPHAHSPGDKHAVHLALVERLRTQAREIQRLTSGLDEHALATPTVAGKWSLKELVCHFARMEQVFSDRFARLLTDDQPQIVPYSPEGDAEFDRLTMRPTSEVLTEFLAQRAALCDRLEKLEPAEWHRKGRHPEFSHFDVHFQAEYMAHHEAHHIYQLFQRRVPLGKLPH